MFGRKKKYAITVHGRVVASGDKFQILLYKESSIYGATFEQKSKTQGTRSLHGKEEQLISTYIGKQEVNMGGMGLFSLLFHEYTYTSRYIGYTVYVGGYKILSMRI